jgi:hypothetical protein
MAQREVHILSYFSLPTDLAAAMKSWPEYIRGKGYEVELRSDRGIVQVELRESEDERAFVAVTGPGDDPLFEKVLGSVVYELAAHSDNLMVDRVS